MRPIKLKIKTKIENYPIIIGSNIIKNINTHLNKNSISFNQCLLIVDKNVPTKMVLKIRRSLRRRKYLNLYLKLTKKIKVGNMLIKF